MARRKIILICSSLIIFGGAVWLATRHGPVPAEPNYNGKRLSVWVASVRWDDNGERLTDESVKAVRAIGTNAIPFLLATLQCPDSQSQVQLYRYLARHRLHRYQFINGWLLRASTKRYQAAVGFQVLGLEARSAIPTLVRLVLTSSNAGIRDAAINALKEADKEAIPLLAQGLQSDDREVRVRAADALFWDRQSPDIAIPALVKVLSDPAAEVRASAVSALGAYQEFEVQLVPQINALLSDPNAIVRDNAAQALITIKAKPVATK